MDGSAVANLYSNYAWALDTHDPEGLRQVFTKDARLTYQGAGGQLLGPFDGIDAIISTMVGAVSALTAMRRHILANHRSGEQTERGLATTATLIVLRFPNEVVEFESSGVFQCEVVEENGVPRFASMHVEFDVPLPKR
jgi:hypothetical protein